MLILTRRANESIVIDNDIEITILSTSVNKVQIGVDAPKNIEVFRKESVPRSSKVGWMTLEQNCF